MKAVQQQGRDNARTPIQWDNSPHAGFTTGTPWLKVNPNYTDINVQAALADKQSIFFFYKQLLAFRKAHKSLIYGDFELFLPDSEDIFAYRRWDEQGDFVVVLNFTSAPKTYELPVDLNNYQMMLSNYQTANEFLLPWEARVYSKVTH